MSIENPTTYGEFWYAKQVDANKAFADAEEKVIAPLLHALVEMVSDLDDFPAPLLNMFASVGTEGHFGVSTIAKDAMGQTGSASLTAGLSPFLRSLGYAANRKFQSARIPFETAISLAHKGRLPTDIFTSRAKDHGFQEAEARLLYEDAEPYPSIEDLIRYYRYQTADAETFTKVQERMDVRDDMFAIWDWLTANIPSTGDIQQLFVREYITEQEAMTELRRQGWNNADSYALLETAYVIPNAGFLLQDALLRGERDDEISRQLQRSGIHPAYVNAFINASLIKPDPTDIIRYMLRRDPNLSELEESLTRIGVHPAYIDIFRTLAYPVPAVGDMITMAVREAFSPEIASRFGQYDDYPTELTRFAAMNGISEEWAKRYWAAHWSLPSPQQGFEMYHRGIIGRDELTLLMRALDIMPFWRDKLIEMAYKPLTRIDVRRMYALGVLSEVEVEKAFRDVGYNDDNARRMREFVVQQTRQSQSGMSVSKIVTAYKNGYTTRNDAYTDILRIGLTDRAVSEVLASADRQLEWQRTKDAISAIGNQYKQDLINDEQAATQLRQLQLDSNKVTNLLARWERDGIKEHKTLWSKADVVSMLKKKIINPSRALQELGWLGYNTERANALIALATETGK